MDEKLLTIAEAAKFLNVSIDTLRRWDKSGKLVAIRKQSGGNLYYTERNLEISTSDLLKLANDWVILGTEISSQFYCPDISIFQARLIKMQNLLIKFGKASGIFSLIVAVAGEIGDNSYAHNLGKWPRDPGIFFGYDVNRGIIALADKGLGVLSTLSRVKPELNNHLDAVRVAFTEVISGRAPEKRGNGLKFVHKVISENPINLFFQSGDAQIRIKANNPDLDITRSNVNIQGCLASIEF